MAFRIVWHEGWPYPVTGHPNRHDEEASHWYVQTRDGTWHPVARRAPGTGLDEVWEELQHTVREWLTAKVARGAHLLPHTLTVEVRLHAFVGALERLRPVLGGIVNTERGQCYVELATVTRLPKPRTADVVRHAQDRHLAVFDVSFRTTDHPLGLHLQFNATDFLEAVVQQYLRLRPSDAPISQPRASN